MLEGYFSQIGVPSNYGQYIKALVFYTCSLPRLLLYIT